MRRSCWRNTASWRTTPHLNGDRVQEEYYLQFADHYFRVLADARVRQEEQRAPRPERWQEGGESGTWREDGEEQGEYAAEGEFRRLRTAATLSAPPSPSTLRTSG